MENDRQRDAEVAEQLFQIGERVRFTLPKEPALKGIKANLLTSEGFICKIRLKLGRVLYTVRLQKSILGDETYGDYGERLESLAALDQQNEIGG